MSIIKSIKQQLGLGPAAENHFFDGSVPNQLSLKRGTPEAPGAEIIKVLNGVLSFPNQGQSLTNGGYIKLPGGLIVQWGTVSVGAGGLGQVALAVPLTQELAFSVSILNNSVSSLVAAGQLTTTTMSFAVTNASTGVGQAGAFVSWIAIGY